MSEVGNQVEYANESESPTSPIEGEGSFESEQEAKIRNQGVEGKPHNCEHTIFLKPFCKSNSLILGRLNATLQFLVSSTKAAFTLAEVLITLGIIGVVAAMTLPVLTGKYQKVQAVTRLKKAYTTMSQALTRAQADYGDAKLWDNLTVDAEINTGNIIIAQQVEKYILPYLSNVISSGLSTLTEKGYDVYYTSQGSTNTNLPGGTQKYYIIEMADSTTFLFTRESTGYLLIYFDINGIKKNNIWGKDAFIFHVEPNTGKFLPYGYQHSRAANLSGCRTDGRQCGALIMQDGWEIKSDYPINF